MEAVWGNPDLTRQIFKMAYGDMPNECCGYMCKSKNVPLHILKRYIFSVDYFHPSIPRLFKEGHYRIDNGPLSHIKPEYLMDPKIMADVTVKDDGHYENAWYCADCYSCLTFRTTLLEKAISLFTTHTKQEVLKIRGGGLLFLTHKNKRRQAKAVAYEKAIYDDFKLDNKRRRMLDENSRQAYEDALATHKKYLNINI